VNSCMMMIRTKLANKVLSIKTRLKGSPFFWQSMANYTERVFGLVYSLILARVLLPEVFGVFAYGLGIAQLVSILTRWDVGGLVRVDSYYQNEGFASAWTLTRLLVLVEVFVIVLVAGSCWYWGVNPQVCAVVLGCGVFTALDKFSVILRCDLEGKSTFRSNLTAKLLMAPAAAIVTIPLALWGFGIWALIASSWVGVSVNWFVYRRANKRKLSSDRIGVEMIRKIVRPSFWIWINYMCLVIFSRADKVLLGRTQSSDDVGYYNRAFNYSPLSFMALGAIADAPAIVAFRNIESKRARMKLYIKRASLLTGAGSVFAAMWILWAETLVPLMFGENWLPAVIYFKLFAFFGVVQGFYFLTNALLQGSHHFKAQGVIKLASIAMGALVLCRLGIDTFKVAIVLQGSMLLAAFAMLIYFALCSKDRICIKPLS